MDIPLEKIVCEEVQPPKELLVAMREQGQLVPIIVERNGEAFRVIEGRRRVAALRALGATTVRAEVREVSKEEREALLLTANLARSPNPLMEAKAIRELLSAGWTEKELRERLGLSHWKIRERLQLLKLDTSLQEKVRSGDMTLSAAKVAAKFPQEVQRKLALKEWVTVRDVAEERRRMQMELLDLASIELPPPDDRATLARELRRAAEAFEGRKRQVLLEAAHILERG